MEKNLIKLTDGCILITAEDIIKLKIKNKELLSCVLDLIKHININKYELYEHAIILSNIEKNEELKFSFEEKKDYNQTKVNYSLDKQKYLNIEIEEKKKEKRIIVKIDTGDNKTKTYNLIEEKYLKNKLYERESVLVNNDKTDQLYYKKRSLLTINHANLVTKKDTYECGGQSPITKEYTATLKKPILYSRKRRKVIDAVSLENSMIWSTQYKTQEKTIKKELKK